MLNKIPLKKFFLGVFVIMFLTIFIQRILFNARVIKNRSIGIDFISWMLIFIFLAILAVFITHIIQNYKAKVKAIIYIVAILILIGLTFISCFFYKEYGTYKYEQALQEFEEKNTEEIAQLIDEDESFILLITSKTCPYCVEFLPTINEAIKNNKKIPMYYIQRENDKNSLIEKRLKVKTIPYLVKICNREVEQDYFNNPINFFSDF